MRTEEDTPQLILRRHDVVRRALILRQFADEREDRGDIAPLAKTDV